MDLGEVFFSIKIIIGYSLMAFDNCLDRCIKLHNKFDYNFDFLKYFSLYYQFRTMNFDQSGFFS